MVGFVNYVVVYQGGRMQNLYQRGSHIGSVVDLTVELGRQKDQHRPHLLSLSAQQIVDDDVEQRDFCFELRFEIRLKLLHLLLYGTLDDVSFGHGLYASVCKCKVPNLEIKATQIAPYGQKRLRFCVLLNFGDNGTVYFNNKKSRIKI